MRQMKKTLSMFAATALLCTSFASAYQIEAYGNRSFRTVSVPMDGSSVGRIVTASGSVVDDQRAADIINGVNAGETVTAAINGMFFNSYYNAGQPLAFPGNAPLILTNLAQNGNAIVGNGKSNSIGFTPDGRVLIDVVDMKPQAMVDDKGGVLIWGVNTGHTDPNAVVLITEQMGLPFTGQPDSVGFLIQNGTVVQEVRGTTITLQPSQSLLVFNRDAAASHAGWGILPHVGGTVQLKTEFVSSRGEDWSNMTSMAGGGRMLVHNGVNVAADASYNASLDQDPKQNATSVLQRSFAAVMNNGTVLLGTGTGSFQDIAQFLLNKGATDAISLDGGASSMLYENGTFVTPAGRELASVIVFAAPKVLPVSCKTHINGKEVSFDAYNINGSNYFKLRDFAYALSEHTTSEKCFNVEWNTEKMAVELTSGTAYTAVGGEMAPSQGQAPASSKPNQSPIYKDGSIVPMNAYNINGNNYFKLRDICAAFDIGVNWDNALNLVVVDTTTGYSGS